MPSNAPRVIGPQDGTTIDLGSVGARLLIRAADSGGGFSLVEHPIPPRTLAAPLHRHTREDEYSYVLEGTMGAKLGDAIILAEPGELVVKPRDQWHTFWNAGDTACRILEIISPGGFEGMFVDMAAIVADTGEATTELDERYGVEVDYDSIEPLCRELGLAFPME